MDRIETYSATLMAASTVSSILPRDIGGSEADTGGSSGAGGGPGCLGMVEGGGVATTDTVGFAPVGSET